MTINFFALYRLILLAFTLAGIVQFVRQLLSYKPYYDRLPKFVKTALKNRISRGGGTWLGQQLEPHRRELIINAILLAVLIVLNAIAYTLSW